MRRKLVREPSVEYGTAAQAPQGLEINAVALLPTTIHSRSGSCPTTLYEENDTNMGRVA